MSGLSTPKSPTPAERRVLHVTDDRLAAPLPSRSLFGERTRFDSVALDQALWQAAREPACAAVIDCARSPARQVIDIGRALGTKLPVVLALYEVDLPLADRPALAVIRSIIVRPFRDAQLVAALGCALATSASRGANQEFADRFGLSGREREIVDALASGDRIAGIAQRLGLSLHTVRNNVKATFLKCKVHSQEELIALVRSASSAPPAGASAAPVGKPATTLPAPLSGRPSKPML
jgi:DNA-binding NarL/FixJ family response regulator